MRNRSSGLSHAELLEVSIASLVREWGVSEADARAALMRNHAETLRLGNELAAVWREERSQVAAKPPRRRAPARRRPQPLRALTPDELTERAERADQRWREQVAARAQGIEVHARIPTCSVEGCDRAAHARGWCHKHWMRWRRHGDPHMAARARSA